MRVLILSNSDTGGGAYIAAYRLHKGLIEYNINSIMLVQNKLLDDKTVITFESKYQRFINIARPFFDSLLLKLYKNRYKTTFSNSIICSKKIVKKINSLKPDIVHLHWVNNGMLMIEDLPKINAPIIWTMHDNWLFSGGCHIMWNCNRFQISCGACPILNSSNKYDLSFFNWKRKNRSFKKINNFNIIALSKWIKMSAHNSSLLRNKNIIHLPNPIDTNKFKNLDKTFCREIFNLPLNKKLLLFGSISPFSDVNKGFQFLYDALELLNIPDLELIIIGSNSSNSELTFKYKTHYLGKLSDETSLAVAYNCADVFILPSLQETLSQSLCESISCGTPVVAFNHTGNVDIIDHKLNGYLANEKDVYDLHNGILWVLDNLTLERSKDVRDSIINKFSISNVIPKYIEFYNQIYNLK